MAGAGGTGGGVGSSVEDDCTPARGRNKVKIVSPFNRVSPRTHRILARIVASPRLRRGCVTVFAETESNSWLWDMAGLLTVPALIVLNGLFVAAEFALVSVRKTRVEELAAHNAPGAR